MFPLLRHFPKKLAESQGEATDVAFGATASLIFPSHDRGNPKRSVPFIFGIGGAGVFRRAELTAWRGWVFYKGFPGAAAH